MTSIWLKLFLFAVFGVLLVSVCLAQNNPQEGKMSPEESLNLHEQMGIDYFNQSWGLLEKPDRSKVDEDILINMVHASLFHWRQLDRPVNTMRGEWMVAHVYTLLGHREEALYHAQNTMQWAIDLNSADWDLAYAYEAMARAHALNGSKKEWEHYYQLALEAGKLIREAGDKQQFDKEILDANWFGMK